jgi:FkbM family methyltransferase
VSADIVPKALWSQTGRVALHRAAVASTSSVHPPNFPLLGRFLAQHGEPRTTLATLEVECTDLDGALARLGRQADFIKIDTQGAEYEILSGAARALGDSILGAVVETWTTEVHRGQRLAGDVLRLMHDHGFELFDVSIAAAWHRRRARDVPSLGRRQIVGLDLLFLKEPALDPARFARPAVAAKAAAIAELYGVPELALELLELCVPPTAHERRLVDELRATLMTPAAPGNASAAPAKLHY